jgi:Type I phosphodiesterase / nucleotide pyrophosphatase
LRATSRKKLVLAVIDGLTPGALERAIAEGRLPALGFLFERGAYRVATTTFPSVTPVCLSSLVTGAHPDVHHIPHIAWYHRSERRIVEYGSSFPAMRAVGTRRCIQDTVFEMTRSHLSRGATTVFEALDDAGVVTAAINVTCYRGRTRHAIRLPGVAARNRWYEAAYGPRRFFFYNVFESDATGARIAVRSRPAGSCDAYAGTVGRWLVTRDGFDFLFFYLPDYDYASHAAGPESARDALERADAALAQLMRAAGGFEAFLERYAILVCSDHGQTPVTRVARLSEPFRDLRVFTGRRRRTADRCDVAVAASNRAGMVYRLDGCRETPRELALRLDGDPAADVVLFRERGEAVARRGGAELRITRGDAGWRLRGDAGVLDPAVYPNGIERAWRALACPGAGDVIVSAAPGHEFADAGGSHHAGGGSHGSLVAGDSLVPVLAVGLEPGPDSRRLDIVDVPRLALSHFGVEAPAHELERQVA